jgi:hypothetical protein
MSLTLREEHRLRVFENRILRDANGEWRRLHYEELHRVIKSRKLRWRGHIAGMEEGWSAFKVLTGTLAGKMPLERPRRRWEDNIRMDLKEVGIIMRSWVYSVQDMDNWRALVNPVLNLRVP